jgi:uncharacterized protein YoaH (UPF0181 family)
MAKNSTGDKSARTMNWLTSAGFQGWICSRCEWNSPLPTLLSNAEAKTAYDRLTASKFAQHACSDYPSRLKTGEVSFTERIRQLVSQGFKPKDAVEILMQEIELEHRNDPKMLEQARREGEDFLRRIRAGLL